MSGAGNEPGHAFWRLDLEPSQAGPRPVVALTAGAVAGATLVALGEPIWAAAFSLARDVEVIVTWDSALLLPGSAGLTFVYALIVWALGLVLVFPVWWVLHRLGLRTPVAAAIFGGSASGGAMLAIEGFAPADLPASIATGLVGVVVGLTVWKVAYGQSGKYL